jgi:hypothetical protein
MEEIQLDYATLVSVYQTKVNDLTNQNILLEAKNLILSKKLQELLNNNSNEVKPIPSNRKKGLDKPQEENTF